jgi:cystathionine beta-lyase/cystathionine gamma-synthase
MTPQQRLDAGILPGMLRLSIGLEGEQAMLDDLRRALSAV